jgi:hypothetical protein
MTSLTVALSAKGWAAVVTDATKFPGVDFFHGDRYRPLFLPGKHLFIVAVVALKTGLLMDSAVKNDFTHGIFIESHGSSRRHGQSHTA